MITKSVKASAYGQTLYNLGMMRVATWIGNSGIIRSRKAHKEIVREKVLQRMQMTDGPMDFMEGLLRKQDEWVCLATLTRLVVRAV
jgi:hypothetical protein